MRNAEIDGKKHRDLWVLIFFFLCYLHQVGHAQLFPGLDGDPLVEAIRNEFTPGQLLNDTQIKDTLYARIFINQDSVRCIYSGLPRFLPAGVDPSQWLFGSGSEVGSLNLEHGWPQAKGAAEGTNGNMDMHHLYPSRTAINSDRANFPLVEINDDLTQKWYFMDQEMASKPVFNIDAYSEFRTGSFEPRESVKGDMARAMFYFWTIYREDAVAADPFFFDIQKENLCEWHLQDPADAFETIRNERIAQYQDGKMNPFILDCSLVKRAYCEALPACEVVSSQVLNVEDHRIHYFPSLRQISITGEVEGDVWQLGVFDLMGRYLITEELRTNFPGIPVHLSSGIYIAYAVQGQKWLIHKFFIP